jgi:hypothetical protein
MSNAAPWPSVAFLEALRPESGWTVDTALLASYSADIVSLVAALLALAGRDDDDGDGNPADLADAVELLRGKIFFVVQEGRLAAMRRRAAIAVIIDQFVRSVRSDEEAGSWHPKLAFIRFNAPEGKVWRLWMGSRNLTVASNLDFGLTLNGREDVADGVDIQGIPPVLRRLAENAGLPRVRVSKLVAACGRVRWSMPKGLSILDFQMLPALKPTHAIPRFEGADEVVVISPFLDGAFVSAAAKWGRSAETPRYLVSTEAELRKLAHQQGKPLESFKSNLLILESPASEETAPGPIVEGGATASDGELPDEERLDQGLHAKLFAVRHKSTWLMWAGSANATMRAWGGANHEAVMLLTGERVIGQGLHQLLGRCRTVKLDTLLSSPPADENDTEADIERARKQLSAAFEGHLNRDGNSFRIVCDAPFPQLPSHVCVQVALMTGSLVNWPAQAQSLELGHFDVADQTGLVLWRLSIGKIECRWLQGLEVRPALPKERDQAAIAARMTPNQFVAWVRSLLSGEPDIASGLGSWKSQGELGLAARLPMITLEEVLGCRARRGSRIADLDARIGTYLDQLMRRHASQPELLGQLQAFSDIWKLVRTELLS